MDNDDHSSGRNCRQNYIRPSSSSMTRAPSWNPGYGAHSSDETNSHEDEEADVSGSELDEDANRISTAPARTNDASNNQSCEDMQLDPELVRQIKLGIEFEIPTVYLKRDDDSASSSSSFHVYQMHIKTGTNARWSIYKRYSQFLEFHHKLRLIEPAVRGVPFPPKKRLNSKASTIVQDRRRKLEDYIRKINDIVAGLPIVPADIDCFQKLSNLVSDDCSQTTQQVGPGADSSEVGSSSESQHSEQDQERSDRDSQKQQQETCSKSAAAEKVPALLGARCLFYKFITPNSSQDQTTV